MFLRYKWLAVAGILVLLIFFNPSWAENTRPSVAGPWYEDPSRSDDLRKFLQQNIQYIDISAVRFRGTRSRGAVITGNYRRKLSDKKVNEMLNFINAIVPLKPVIGIEQSETEVIFLYPEKETRLVRLLDVDLPETRQSTANKRDQSLVLAAWEEDVLIIETNSTSGVSVVEKIGLDKNAEEITLRVETIIDTPRLPVNLIFNRYYKPYPSLP